MRARIKLFTPIQKNRQQITLELSADFTEEYESLKDCEVDVEIKKHREKRSLTANAYFWVLIGKIAEKLSIPDDEVYRQMIKDVGVSEVICVPKRAAALLEKTWSANGKGFFTETLDVGDQVTMKLYYGSHLYNTKQMSRLIDNAVQDAKALGITTETPDQIARMVSLWNPS